jgi:hypothetical protein
MDFHKTLQSSAGFENIQVTIAPIVKDKLLVLNIWYRYIWLKSMNTKIKKLYVITKAKNLRFPWQFDQVSQSYIKDH